MTEAADRYTDYADVTAALRFVVRQMLKGLSFCMPGVIVSYDAPSRRASVRPALAITTAKGRFIERPVVTDVPVVFPGGGGFLLQFPLSSGDPVLLVYSQRGLNGWKLTHGLAPPDMDSLFGEGDAIAIPGLGPLSITPGSDAGVSLQDFDAGNVIAVEGNGIRIKSTGTVAIEASDLTFRAVGSGEEAESIV